MPTWPNRPAEEYIDGLSDTDYRMRRQAAAALEVLGEGRAVPPLIHALHDPHQEVRATAARALGKLGEHAAVTPLVALLQDSVADVRVTAVRALVQLGGQHSVSALVQALRDPHEAVRHEAVQGLGQLGDARAIPALVAAMEEAQAEARLFIAIALAQCGDSAVPVLLDLLSHADRDSRPLLVQALGFTKAPHVIGVLREALQDKDSAVRDSAKLALMQLQAHLVETSDPFADHPDLPDTVRWLSQHIRQQYRRAGTPYGKTVEGLRRWLAEQCN